MRVLITGGAGFIGSHLAERFLAEGHQVIVMDNLLTGDAANIAHLFGRGDLPDNIAFDSNIQALTLWQAGKI